MRRQVHFTSISAKIGKCNIVAFNELSYICNLVAFRMNNELSAKSDKAGIASAVLCTIHCLVVPVLFLLKMSWTQHTAIDLPSWWEKIDYLFLLISFFAVYHSASHTKTIEIKYSLWLFWSILVLAIVFQSKLHWLAYIASAGLVITHLINIRRMKVG